VEYEDVGCTVFNLAGHPAETRALHLVIAELIEGSTKLRGAACQSDHLRSWRFAASVLCQAYGIASRLGSDFSSSRFLSGDHGDSSLVISVRPSWTHLLAAMSIPAGGKPADER
jgi:hypothetical protein